MQIKKRTVTFSLVVALSVLWFGTLLAYKLELFSQLTEDEMIFIRDVEEALNDSPDGEVLIRSIANFNWDRVCIHRADSMSNIVPEALTDNLEYMKLIKENFASLSFFKDKNLVQVLGYRGSEYLVIKDKKYRFLASFEQNICHMRPFAKLKTKEIDTECCGLLHEIILTGE
jgi:hypothetical protein